MNNEVYNFTLNIDWKLINLISAIFIQTTV